MAVSHLFGQLKYGRSGLFYFLAAQPPATSYIMIYNIYMYINCVHYRSQYSHYIS